MNTPPSVAITRHEDEIIKYLDEGFSIRSVYKMIISKYDYSFTYEGFWRAWKRYNEGKK